MKEFTLRTFNLGKDYGKGFVIRNVNIEIEKAQIYGLVGLNGVGKTSILKMIMGSTKITEGSIELFGDTSNFSKSRQRIGSLLDQGTTYSDMTVEQNLNIYRLVAKIPGDNCVKKALTTFGLCGTQKVKKLSLGMKQRLGLAQVLMTNPEFIILDEPFNGLDPTYFALLKETLVSLAKEKGVTVFIVSHALNELSQMISNVGIIKNGTLYDQMTIKEVHKQCYGYTKCVVGDVEKAVTILESDLGISDLMVCYGNEIRLMAQPVDAIDFSRRITAALSPVGLYSLDTVSKDFEQYILGIVGENNHVKS